MNDKDLENFNTTYDLSKIPKKKLNYKKLLYRQRLRYGKFIDIGLVIDSLLFTYKNGQMVYQINNTCNENVDILMEDQFYKSLFYSSDLDFSTRPSKREMKLRKIMHEKINRLKEITTSQYINSSNIDNVSNNNNINITNNNTSSNV